MSICDECVFKYVMAERRQDACAYCDGEAQAQAEANAREAMEKLTDAQKRLKMASPTVTEFKALFEQVQEIAKKMKAKIEVVKAEDPETAARLEAAMKAFGASL